MGNGLGAGEFIISLSPKSRPPALPRALDTGPVVTMRWYQVGKFGPLHYLLEIIVTNHHGDMASTSLSTSIL